MRVSCGIWGLAVWAGFAFGAGSARADAGKVGGFGPDLQVTGGVGFGLGGSLENNFLARGRLGALFANDPWVANAGVTFEAGALGRLGIGGEFEINLWGGWFVDLGLARVEGAAWMTHLSAGFTVLGVEWQHRFDSKGPSDALLLEVRLPIGLWWFFIGRKTDKATITDARARAAAAQTPPPAAAGALGPARSGPRPARAQLPKGLPPGPPLFPSGRSASTLRAEPPATGPGLSPVPSSSAQPSPPTTAPAPDRRGLPPSAANAPSRAPGADATSKAAAFERDATVAAGQPSPKQREQIDAAVAEASRARERGDHVAAAAALERAYAVFPESVLLLQLAEAERAAGSLLRAADTLRKFLASAPGETDVARKPQVQADLAALQSRIPQLRLELKNARGDELIEIDRRAERGATLGYDVPLDPGEHQLVVSRAGKVLAQRSLRVEESKLTRVAIDLAQPDVAP